MEKDKVKKISIKPLKTSEESSGLDSQTQNPDVEVEKKKFGIPEPKWSPPDLFRRRNRPSINIVNALNNFATRPSGFNFTKSS